MDARQLQDILDRIASDLQDTHFRGEVAHYIPELARIDVKKFAIAVCLASGQVIKAGDADEPFSIQSISKVFTLAMALGRFGDALWNRVGREPSGHAFNSILQLETEKGKPRNPFVNAGALVVTDTILAGRPPREALGEILQFIRTAAGDDDIAINPEVARSEREMGYRNIALANYMKAFGTIANAPEMALGTYFHQCAIEMSCVQLAKAGRFLLGHPDHELIPAAKIRHINALMMTCGHYDASGDFAYRVGLPGKSGVGGGILAIAPGRASIAIWSPGLNAYGNSHLGALAAEALAAATGWSVFG